MKRASIALGLGLVLSLPQMALADVDPYSAKFRCLSANYKNKGELPKLPGFAKLDSETFVYVRPVNRYNSEMDIYVYSKTGIYHYRKDSEERERIKVPGASSFVVAMPARGGLNHDFMLIANTTASNDRVRQLGANDLNKGGLGERMLDVNLHPYINGENLFMEVEDQLLDNGHAKLMFEIQELKKERDAHEKGSPEWKNFEKQIRALDKEAAKYAKAAQKTEGKRAKELYEDKYKERFEACRDVPGAEKMAETVQLRFGKYMKKGATVKVESVTSTDSPRQTAAEVK